MWTKGSVLGKAEWLSQVVFDSTSFGSSLSWRFGWALGGLLTRTLRAAGSYGYSLQVCFFCGVSTKDAAVLALISAYLVCSMSHLLAVPCICNIQLIGGYDKQVRQENDFSYAQSRMG
jgi:hypothetical protein